MIENSDNIQIMEVWKSEKEKYVLKLEEFNNTTETERVKNFDNLWNV